VPGPDQRCCVGCGGAGHGEADGGCAGDATTGAGAGAAAVGLAAAGFALVFFFGAGFFAGLADFAGGAGSSSTVTGLGCIDGEPPVTLTGSSVSVSGK